MGAVAGWVAEGERGWGVRAELRVAWTGWEGVDSEALLVWVAAAVRGLLHKGRRDFRRGHAVNAIV